MWGKISRGKKGKGKQYHLPKNIKVVGKNIKCSNSGRGRKFYERNQNFKKGGGEEYQVATALLDPLEVLGPVCHNLPHLCSDVHPQAEADVKLPK